MEILHRFAQQATRHDGLASAAQQHRDGLQDVGRCSADAAVVCASATGSAERASAANSLPMSLTKRLAINCGVRAAFGTASSALMKPRRA